MPSNQDYTEEILECPNCQGTGEAVCRICKGDGQVPEEYGNLVNCKECGGISRTKCLQCGGSGKINKNNT